MDEKKNSIVGAPVNKDKYAVFFNGENSRVKIGRNVNFNNCRLKLFNDSEIEIGDGGYLTGTFFAHNKSKIVIGDRCRVNGKMNISAYEGANVKLGEDCLVSDVTIKASDMHAIYDLETNERINPAKDVVIGDRVWIGDGVIILKGVKIGHDSIIGARSVVTKNVPSNVIVAGNPAKIIKTNVYWFKKRG